MLILQCLNLINVLMIKIIQKILLVPYYFLTKTVIQSNLNKQIGGTLKDYLSKEEYSDLTNSLRELVEKRREPTTTYDFAFGYGYDGHLAGEPFLRIYAEYLTLYSKPNVKDLHALCLGYGTAGSVLTELENRDDNKENKTYH